MVKLGFLFIAVWFTIVNVGRISLQNKLPPINLLLQAIGITGFVWLQWIN